MTILQLQCFLLNLTSVPLIKIILKLVYVFAKEAMVNGEELELS